MRKGQGKATGLPGATSTNAAMNPGSPGRKGTIAGGGVGGSNPNIPGSLGSLGPMMSGSGGGGLRPQSPMESLAVPAEWLSEPNPAGPLNNPNGVLGSHIQSTSSVINTTGNNFLLAADTAPTAATGNNNNASRQTASYSLALNLNLIPTVPKSGLFSTSSGTMIGDTAANSKQTNAAATKDTIARTNHLTLHYQDKLFTWGGWYGCASDKAPAEVLCCYGLNPSNSAIAANGSIVAATATGTSGANNTTTTTGQQSNAAAAATANNNNAVAAAAAANTTTSGWMLSGFVLVGNPQQCHPASSQFASCEIAPGVAILFGGWTGTTRTNAVTMLSVPQMRWRTLETTGDKPPALTFSSIVCSNGGKKVAIYGGNGMDGPSSDVYVLDLVTLHWRLLPSAGCPAKRSSHSACLVRDSLMVVFGGRSITDLASLSLGDGSGGVGLMSLNNTAGSGFNNMNNNASFSGGGGNNTNAASGNTGGASSSKAGKSSNKDNNNNNGTGNQNDPQAPALQFANTPLLMNDFGVFDLASNHWQIGLRVEGIAPPARYGHTAVATQNHIFVFGGIGDGGNLLNDVWALSFDKPGAIVWKPVIFREATPGGGARTPTPPTLLPGSPVMPQLQSHQLSHIASPYQPSPRVGACLVRISKTCLAVCGGRTGPSTLMTQKPTNSKFPSSSSVHFLDISRIISEELLVLHQQQQQQQQNNGGHSSGGNNNQGMTGRGSEVNTPL